MLRLTRWLAEFPPDDFGARLIARYAFVHLDMFVKVAPQVKNEHKPVRGAVLVAELIAKLTKDYESFYARIRDEHTAHRGDSDLFDLIDTWNAIDVTALNLFVLAAVEIYGQLVTLDPMLPTLTSPDGGASAHLLECLSRLGSATADQPVVQVDTLAATRPNALIFAPTHPLQRAGFRIVGTIDAIHYLERLCELILAGAGSTDLIFLTRSMVLLEVINLIDCLYPTRPSADHAGTSLLDLAEEANVGDQPALRIAFQQLDVARVAKVRIARNTIAAHIDPTVALETLQARLRDLSEDDLRAIWRPAAVAFDRWCKSDILGRLFLLHNREIPDATRTVGTEALQKPFRDA